jgi:hypothetical protein
MGLRGSSWSYCPQSQLGLQLLEGRLGLLHVPAKIPTRFAGELLPHAANIVNRRIFRRC